MIIVIQCKDRVGLVAAIAGLMAAEQINIISMREHVDTVEELFFARLQVQKDINGTDLQEKLKAVLPGGAMVQVNPLPEKKLAVFVTKEYHCLSDILVRNHFKTLGASVQCVIGNHNTMADICRRFDIPFHFVLGDGKTKEAFEEELLARLAPIVGEDMAHATLTADQATEAGIEEQRKRVEEIRAILAKIDMGVALSEARNLNAIADALVRKSVWIIGGDGWAYDIGFGGLDHVLGSGKNINVLVLDTEVYSNTGGQMSKSTPRGAVAKFAAGGKPNSKKDLAMEAVSYGSVYVARVALGGNDTQVIKAFQEAEAHNGPSIIIAYSHCIAHGYDLVHGLEQQKAAVLSGYWPLMRYNPALRTEGKNPFQLDSKAPSIPLKEYAYREARYTMLARSHPEDAKILLSEAQDDVERQWRVYSARAAMPGRGETPHIAPPEEEFVPH